ncbi:MAG: VWA domain-containing protein [Acidobacteriota bacterium]
MSRRALGVLLAAAAMLSSAPQVAAQEVDLMLLAPPRTQPLIGPSRAVVEIIGDAPVDRIEVLFGDQVLGFKSEPPWEIEFDAGPENRPRSLRLRASFRGYTMGEMVADFPAFQVDSQIDAELRPIYVTATAQGRRVLHLGREDFEIYDDGSRQQIVTFGRGDVEITASILIDASSSMAGRRLRFALRGAAAFVQGLSNPEDEAAIRLFSDRLLHAPPFATDARRALAGLTKVRATGGTALADHLYFGLKELEGRQGRRVLLLLTDGVDSHSTLEMADVAWLARRSRAQIFWIRTDPRDREEARYSAWKDPDRYRAEFSLLRRIVDDSGGRVITLDTIDQTAVAVREVLAELREQYVLGFQPTVVRHDGSWRRLSVRVKQPGVRLRSRDGYIDD